MNARNLAAVLLPVLLLGACLTAPPMQSEMQSEMQSGMQSEVHTSTVIGLINDGNVETLVGRSNVPFFFDGELLVRTADVELLWTGLRAADFEVSMMDMVVQPFSPGDYRLVADNFDMESHFAPGGVIPGGSEWIIAPSSVGTVRILVADRQGPTPVIFGIARSSNE